MKRVWKISDAAQSELFLHRTSAKTKPLTPNHSYLFNTSIRTSTNRFIREICHSNPSFSSHPFPNIIGLFSDRLCDADVKDKEDLITKVSKLRDELVQNEDKNEQILLVLDEKGSALLRSYSDGAAFVELLHQLDSSRQLAFEVFNWRRKQEENNFPMTSEEYVKGIKLAGRLKNVDLAVELFTEAANKRIKTTSTYNALMAAYMYNYFAEKCQLVFGDLKRDAICRPTIVTYNILLSVFNRLMLIDHMEAVLREIKDLNITPNVNTYNTVIAGYITAWMWDCMEKTYIIMKAGSIKPNLYTHLLMLRGYAHSGNLEKMEEIYELVNYHVVNHREFALIRAMICAYCRSTSTSRVEKVEELLKLIPKDEYRPWLNVLLIRLYAQEDIVDMMESYINEAFENNTSVTTVAIMRCIITSYFRGNAVDKLANFVKRAEYAGWRICRSLYHCKMIMYSSQNRLDEMEGVLAEMENFNLHPTKKTFLIMYEAYSTLGKRRKLDQVLGVMCKYGYGIPLNPFH